MRDILNELDKIFKASNSFAVTLLRKGNSQQNIADMLKKQKFEAFPRELNDLFLWHDGMEKSNEMLGKLQLFSFGYFLPLQAAFDVWSANTRLWGNEFFPVSTNNGGDFLLFHLEDRFIYLYSPTVLLSKMPISIYDSLKSMLETVKECYLKKAYYFEDDFLGIDYDLEEEISKQINPQSQYWDQD